MNLDETMLKKPACHTIPQRALASSMAPLAIGHGRSARQWHCADTGRWPQALPPRRHDSGDNGENPIKKLWSSLVLEVRENLRTILTAWFCTVLVKLFIADTYYIP